MSLRHGSRVAARPVARLSGWFERRTSSFWPVRRWLELDGSLLTYRHREHADVVWTCDLRECGLSAGRGPLEIVLVRPGEQRFSLFAVGAEELKVWFAEMKKVSDSVYDFYHFSAKVGHTGSGAIYLGRDKKSEQDVAILAEDKTRLDLQKTMILTKRDLSVVAATQSHEGLVRVVDMFESTKRFYTITELVTGGTLHEALSREPISEATARSVMGDILHALQHLHSRDIVHGSVDAQHVVCSRRGLPCRVKLAAFGQAVARRDARLLGGGAGRDAAPEVVCFGRRSAKSDVFAAGVLLFWMLVGAEPFPAGGEVGYLRCVSRGVRGMVGVGAEARKLVVGMLADDAGGRPSAEECLDCGWFREGVREGDAGAGEAGDGGELGRVRSDPKSVMVEFEMARAVSGGAVSRYGAGGGAGGSYAELDGEVGGGGVSGGGI